MSLALIVALGALVGVLALAVLFYVFTRYFEARYDRTYMTQDERGFRRALEGKTVLWDFEEQVVRGSSAPNIEFVAVDPASGGRRTVRLLDQRSGAVNLRPHYCSPLPFEAMTADSHKVVVDARVQFSLNRKLLKHVYELQEFSLALETRIQSAFRSEIGKRNDEVLRTALHEVERAVIEVLRRQEEEGDESGEPGMAIGVNFHTASFTYAQRDEFAAPTAMPVINASAAGASAPAQIEAVRAAMRAHGVLSLRPQQLDQLADVFAGRDPASTAAMLSMLEMQTRQNIAEALASSGQLIVVTPQDLGLVSAAAIQAGRRATEGPAPQLSNGASRHPPA